MAPTPSTVSFTVRRPTPVSRPSSSGPESDGPFKVPALPRHLTSAGSSATGSPLAGSPKTFSPRDGSDDDGESGIVFFDGSGADDNSHHSDSSDEANVVWSSKQPSGQRLYQKKRKASGAEAPLVIPTKPNPDWREAARRRRAGCARIQPHTSRATPSFVPDSALAPTGTDGSVGGLGTRDTINSGPQLSGLQVNKRVKTEAHEDDGAMVMEVTSEVSAEQSTDGVTEETEDQKALRAILSGETNSAFAVQIIPVPPLSEEDALKQDIQELPDIATADDYERVPVSAFGAAMLRGMGWTDGAVAPKSDERRKNALTELYLPQARPALLGIGAKEREPDDDGSKKKKPKGKDMRYIPVARKESERGGDRSSRSGTVSRYSSRSPPRKEREDRVADLERSTYDDRERRKERDRDRDRNRDRDEESRRDYDGKGRKREDYRDRDKDWDRDKARDRGRDRSEHFRDREREDHTRERDRRDRRGDR